MFRLYQHFSSKTIPNPVYKIHGTKGVFPQLLGYTKLLAMVFLLQMCFLNEAAAQGTSQNGLMAQDASPQTGFIPTTAGDMFLPQGDYASVEMSRLDLSVEIVPLPMADYTGNFGNDVATYQNIVQRWLVAYPESLSQQDDVSQKLIALGYYDTLFKWQVQRNHINKLTK